MAESIVLETVVATDEKNTQNTKISSYNSSQTLSRDKLNTITSKDGTITEVLKVNPNVNFSRKARTGTEAGEISPKDISINGASFYQNSFLIDGVSFNDDINPDGYKTLFKNVWKGPSLGSQAINLSTDLLESIEVFDSSVSAKHGGFQGGVVSSKTRNPRPGFHGIASFGYTSGDWTKTFIDPLVEDKYKNSTGWYDKSDFTKRKYRFGIEGYVTENFGLLFDYTNQKSKQPQSQAF